MEVGRWRRALWLCEQQMFRALARGLIKFREE